MTDLDNLFTDEMLAAYIDGNAIPLEQKMIEGYLDSEEMQEILDVVSDLKACPELLQEGETLQAENPDHLVKDVELSLKDLKQNIVDSNQSII